MVLLGFLDNLDIDKVLLIGGILVVFFPQLKPFLDGLLKLIGYKPDPNPEPSPTPGPGPVPTPTPTPNPVEPKPMDKLLEILKVFIQHKDKEGKQSVMNAIDRLTVIEEARTE